MKQVGRVACLLGDLSVKVEVVYVSVVSRKLSSMCEKSKRFMVLCVLPKMRVIRFEIQLTTPVEFSSLLLHRKCVIVSMPSLQKNLSLTSQFFLINFNRNKLQEPL